MGEHVQTLDDKLKEEKKFKLQGKVSFKGLKIAIENKKGSVRSGVDDDGEEWKTKMFYPYGYIKNTEGVDGDEVDVYVGPNEESDKVFIIHQLNPETKDYDEDKCMLGFDTWEHARDAYLAHYDTYEFLGEHTEMSFEEFKEKLKKRQGKMIKAFRLFGQLIKGVKIKDLLTGDLFAPKVDTGNEVVEGKTVVKNGKTYEYKRSKKNPTVRRLMRTDSDEEDNQISLFSGEGDKPIKQLTRTQRAESKEQSKELDLFGPKGDDKPTEEKQKQKVKLFNQEVDLFGSGKKKPEKEKGTTENKNVKIKESDKKKIAEVFGEEFIEPISSFYDDIVELYPYPKFDRVHGMGIVKVIGASKDQDNYFYVQLANGNIHLSHNYEGYPAKYTEVLKEWGQKEADRALQVGSVLKDKKEDKGPDNNNSKKPETVINQEDTSTKKPVKSTEKEPNSKQPLEQFGIDKPDKKSVKQRKELNDRVKELLASKTNEQFTDEDKKILAQYSGKGGLGGNTFDDISLNEFYTRGQEVSFMWDMLQKMGFKGGNVLEPSCGVGVFIDNALENTLVTGIEIDETSSRVTDILYGNNHDIRNQSFEQFNKDYEGGTYDAVIGNCPFGPRGACIIDDPEKMDYDKHEMYFLDRSIDALKESGLLAMVVPTGIMDNQINQYRLDINKKAEFLGAIRVPTGAFKHAHAQVTTDIVFFRKRPQAAIDYLSSLPKEKYSEMYDKMILDAEFISGKYFEKNPQYALGEQDTGQFGQKIWKGDVTKEELEDVGSILKGSADDYSQIGIDVSKPVEQELHVGDIKQINGRTYRLNENHRWERLKEDELQQAVLPEETKKALGIKNWGEYEELQKDFIKQLDLNRDQLMYLGLNSLEHELEIYKDTNGHKNEYLKKAVILGMEIRKFQKDLQNGIIETSEAQRIAAKLAGELEQFKEKYGHPLHDCKINKYFGKSENNPLLYLAGSFDKEGNLSKIFEDPKSFYNVYKPNADIGKAEDDDLFSIVQYLYDNGLEGDIDTIKSMYKGSLDLEKALLNSEDIFIDENGNYGPINEVCMGEVYIKLDNWEAGKNNANTKLGDSSISDEEREILVMKAKKLEEQIYELRRRADVKELKYLPIELRDAGVFFDIDLLNDYISFHLGADYLEPIIKDKGTGLFMPSSPIYKEAYMLFASKGANDKDDTARLKDLLKLHFSKEMNPKYFLVLNKINNIPIGNIKDREEIEDKYKEIENGFVSYLDCTEYADQIQERYNRAYNNYIQKKYDTRPIEGISKFAYDRVIVTTPDGREITAREKAGDHTWSTVRRMYEQGKGLIAHGVGLGKTLEAILLTLLCKETGRAKKPLIVTPKSVLKNWVEEIDKWTEGVNYLVVGMEKDAKGKWREDTREEKILKLNRIANEDFDMVLMTRDTFRRIDFSPETKKKMMDELVDKYYPEVDEMNKKAKKKRESSLENLAKVMHLADAFEGLYLDNLGVDHIVRDEGHDVKNLLKPIEEEIAGINASDSQRALHNFFASKIIRGKNKERGIYMLTATPISNSPLEVYNMMLPFSEKELENLEIRNMDDFIGRFAEVNTVVTADPDGRIIQKNKFAGWLSSDILRKTFFRFVDYKTKDDVESVKANIKFPKENPGHVISELNEGQKQLMKHCQLRLWTIRYKKWDKERETWFLNEDKLKGDLGLGILTQKEVDAIASYFHDTYLPKYQKINMFRSPDDPPKDDVYFSVQSDMIKITSDLDWYKESTSEFGKPIDDRFAKKHNDLHKFKQLVENTAGIYKSGGKQLIFAINTKLHDKIRADLIKAGINQNDIAIVNGKTMKSAESRSKVSQDYNSGKIKVIIGNYATMGEGLNFNYMTSDIHHLQPAWNYLQIEQGNGRGVRQGNPLDKVNTHYYLSRGSVDTFMKDKIQSKGGMVDKFLRGELSKWDDDVTLDGEEMLIALAENPETAKKLLEARESNLKKAMEEKEKLESWRKFDQLFDVKSKIGRIEDRESRRYKILEQEVKRLTESLNGNPHFQFKEHLTLDRKPIPIPQHNVVLPVGSVIKYGYNDNEFAVIDDYTPSTGRIQITTYNGDDSETKTMTYKDFIPQYGETIEKQDFDTAGMFKKLIEDEGLSKMSVISKIPLDILKANKKKLLSNIKNAYYSPILYQTMDGNFKIETSNSALDDIAENGGKIFFPQELPDLPKIVKNIYDNARYKHYSQEYARSIYGDNWESQIKKEIKKLQGKTVTSKFVIPRSGVAYIKRMNELAEKGIIEDYEAKDILKRSNSRYEWDRKIAVSDYQEALRKEFMQEYGIKSDENSENNYILPLEINEEMLDRARAIDDLDDRMKFKPLEDILTNNLQSEAA